MEYVEELEKEKPGLKPIFQNHYSPCLTLATEKSLEKSPVASIVIPVYNEADIIFENVLYLSTYLGAGYELIVCDDNSDDGTFDMLSAAMMQRSNIRLLRFRERIGKGGTIKKAIEIAKGEVIVFMDADLSANLKHVSKMLSLASGKDVLVISRRTIRDRLTQGILRLMLSVGYNLTVRLVFRTGIRDHQCGFKAMNKEVAKRLTSQTGNNRFVFDTELIVVAKKLGILLKEVQIEWIDRRQRSSNIKWIREIPRMIKDVMILNRDLRKVVTR
jgi:glycosyltransferase involved in cell wall biosynthesis